MTKEKLEREGDAKFRAQVGDAIYALYNVLENNAKTPSKYIPLKKILPRFLNIAEHKKQLATMNQILFGNKVLIAEVEKDAIEIGKLSEKLRNKRHTKEYYYNFVCDSNPRSSYENIHRHLRRLPEYSSSLLRQYKRRRIIRIKDYREVKDTQNVMDVLRRNDYRLSQDELQRKTHIDKNILIDVLKKLERGGKIAFSKAVYGKQLVDVIVLRTS